MKNGGPSRSRCSSAQAQAAEPGWPGGWRGRVRSSGLLRYLWCDLIPWSQQESGWNLAWKMAFLWHLIWLESGWLEKYGNFEFCGMTWSGAFFSEDKEAWDDLGWFLDRKMSNGSNLKDNEFLWIRELSVTWEEYGNWNHLLHHLAVTIQVWQGYSPILNQIDLSTHFLTEFDVSYESNSPDTSKMLPQKVNHRWWSEVQSSFKPSFKLECIPDVGPAIFRGTFVPSGPWPRWSGWGRLSWNTAACACWPPSALLRSSMCNSQVPDFGAVFDKGKSWVRLGWPVMVWQRLGSFCKTVKLVADWSFPMLRN